MKFLKRFEGIDDIDKLSGWVNVKIDDQLYIRMAKYVTALDTLVSRVKDRYDLYKKIEMLSKVDEYIENKNVDIQTKLSIITLLQYLNELKGKFNASTAGFLLEGFLAALIHGKKDEDAYGYVDINSSYSDLDAVQFNTESGGRGVKKLKYQIKLYKNKGNIKINWKKPCDYYVICLKNEDNTIDVHILSNDPKDINSYIGNYLAKPWEISMSDFIQSLNNLDENGNRKSDVSLNTNKLYTKGHKFLIKLDVASNTIERLISSCGDNIKNSISKVYSGLSELQYDVDSLVTGYDKNKRRITVDLAKSNADLTIDRITADITNLRGNF
jgi:hypothetical protein